MRKLLHDALCITLSLSLTLLGTGCQRGTTDGAMNEPEPALTSPAEAEGEPSDIEFEINDENDLHFASLNDESLLQYVADDLEGSIESELASDDYQVIDVASVYVSKEYLEELEYNSKENVFFGYTLAELEEQLGDQRYVFTVGDDGHTTVAAFSEYEDPMIPVLKNLAIGGGVILVCVTISVATGGATVGAAYVVHEVFAASATTAAKAAVSTGAMSALTSGIVTGYQTGDMEAALRAAAIDGSKGFKIGAITGAVAGGAGKGLDLLKSSRTVHSWQESEAEVLKRYGGKDQVSYLKGEEVSNVEGGCTRPDVMRWFKGHREAIEVKNYNLKSAKSYYQLKRELERQITQRTIDLPPGTTQRVVLDVRGYGYSKQFLDSVVKELANLLTPIDSSVVIDLLTV